MTQVDDSRFFGANIFLASLTGCADLSFRLIAREHGAEFCFYEMFDANSLAYTSRVKIQDMAQTHTKDLPIAAQLLGSDPDLMLKGANKLLELNSQISFMDINSACPVKKVIKKKAGAYLLKEPESLYRIIDKLASALPIPVTVKLRIGYASKDLEKIVGIARKCEECGAQALFVHGRTQAQLYYGEVDHSSIKAIKARVKVPVFFSGNIFTPQQAKQALEDTNCDGVLVARGAFGNPWIFQQIKAFLQDGTLLPEPALEERIAVLKRHIQYIEEYKIAPQKTKLGFARKAALWYLKNFKNAAHLRHEASLAKTFGELYGLLEQPLEG